MKLGRVNSVLGFTLIELLAVIAVIGILATVVATNLNQSSATSRDAKRKADLRNLQNAVEIYKNREGRYPAGCKGANQWSGQIGTDYACTGTEEYILGLVPQYIDSLPIDKKLNGANSGYVYVTNTEGSVYKIMAMNTVESEVLNTSVAYNHPFKSCDVKPSIGADGIVNNILQTQSICYQTYDGVSNNPVPHCAIDNARFQRSYAVWGGYDSGGNLDSNPVLSPMEIRSLKNTTDIICK